VDVVFPYELLGLSEKFLMQGNS